MKHRFLSIHVPESRVLRTNTYTCWCAVDRTTCCVAVAGVPWADPRRRNSAQELLLHRPAEVFPEACGMRKPPAQSAREGEKADPPGFDDSNYDKHDGKSINRTRLVGGLWISNSRLLCLVMALDLMTMTVQVCRRAFERVAVFFGNNADALAPSSVARISKSLNLLHQINTGIGSSIGNVTCNYGRNCKNRFHIIFNYLTVLNFPSVIFQVEISPWMPGFL